MAVVLGKSFALLHTSGLRDIQKNFRGINQPWLQ